MFTSRPATTSSEIKPLTALRMIAALMVFFYHYNDITSANEGDLSSRLILEAHIGVNLFFVLSGFLITLRYLPPVEDSSFSYRDYLIKRIARIWPLYFVLLIPTVLLSPPPDLFVNLTFTQGYFEGLRTSGIPTAWSLSVEEAFYLVAPLLLAFSVRHQSLIRRIALRLLLITAALFAIGIVLIYVPIAKQEPYGFMLNLEHVAWYTLFGRMFDFAAGILAAVIILRVGKPQPRLASRLFWASVVGIALLEIAMNLINNYGLSWVLNYPLAFCAAALMVSLTASGTLVSRILSHPLLVYGGRISYALYLIQSTPMVVTLVSFCFQIFHFNFSTPIGLYILLSLISVVLYNVIERPARWLIIRRFNARHIQPSAEIAADGSA